MINKNSPPNCSSHDSMRSLARCYMVKYSLQWLKMVEWGWWYRTDHLLMTATKWTCYKNYICKLSEHRDAFITFHNPSDWLKISEVFSSIALTSAFFVIKGLNNFETAVIKSSLLCCIWGHHFLYYLLSYIYIVGWLIFLVNNWKIVNWAKKWNFNGGGFE